MKPMKEWFKSIVSNDARTAKRHKSPPLVAYFWDGGSPVAHPVRNISPTGFYLETTERWLLGTLVMMNLQHSSRDPLLASRAIIVMAKVIRHGEDGVGFSFVFIEDSGSARELGPVSQPADRRSLERFLDLIGSDELYPRFD